MCKNRHVQIKLIPGSLKRACGIKLVLNRFVRHFGSSYLLVESRFLHKALVEDSEVYVGH